jgi:hypothetical protein
VDIGGNGEWLPGRNNFLFPVKALSKIFRAKFRDALQEEDCFEDISDRVWKQDWVVHCQQVGKGVAALKYLAPYIFRVAISNRRFVRLSGGRVTYLYKPHGTKKYRRRTVQLLADASNLERAGCVAPDQCPVSCGRAQNPAR